MMLLFLLTTLLLSTTLAADATVPHYWSASMPSALPTISADQCESYWRNLQNCYSSASEQATANPTAPPAIPPSKPAPFDIPQYCIALAESLRSIMAICGWSTGIPATDSAPTTTLARAHQPPGSLTERDVTCAAGYRYLSSYHNAYNYYICCPLDKNELLLPDQGAPSCCSKVFKDCVAPGNIVDWCPSGQEVTDYGGVKSCRHTEPTRRGFPWSVETRRPSTLHPKVTYSTLWSLVPSSTISARAAAPEHVTDGINPSYQSNTMGVVPEIEGARPSQSSSQPLPDQHPPYFCGWKGCAAGWSPLHIGDGQCICVQNPQSSVPASPTLSAAISHPTITGFIGEDQRRGAQPPWTWALPRYYSETRSGTTTTFITVRPQTTARPTSLASSMTGFATLTIDGQSFVHPSGVCGFCHDAELSNFKYSLPFGVMGPDAEKFCSASAAGCPTSRSTQTQ